MAANSQGKGKRVAVIGAGPSGAITIDALAREPQGSFSQIRVFERRHAPGGCWLDDAGRKPPDLGDVRLPSTSNGNEANGGKKAGSDGGVHLLDALSTRTADRPRDDIPPAECLPTKTRKRFGADGKSDCISGEASEKTENEDWPPRFAESSIYPYLETNVDLETMRYSEEPIATDFAPTELSVRRHGADTPFRHWTAMRGYVEELVERRGYRKLIAFGTTVEFAEKVRGDQGKDEWRLVLRKEVEDNDIDGNGAKEGEEAKKRKGWDYWWEERFDAVVVASGHFNVPYVPHIEGLTEFAANHPGSVMHSKQFRGRDDFRDKRVVVVGASVSAGDIAFDLVDTTSSPVYAVVVGRNANPYFGIAPFLHPGIKQVPTIAKVDGGKGARRTVHFIDGTSVEDVDHIIFGTGYSFSVPFLANVVRTRNNRIPGLYQHVVWREDPSLLFVGAVGAGLTFKIFEWQAVLAARLLAGTDAGLIPGKEEMVRWEEERIKARGDGGKFLMIHPDFEEYFETVRRFAGEGKEGDEKKMGPRRLPPFDPAWFDLFMKGHERRKDMWARTIAEAKKARQS